MRLHGFMFQFMVDGVDEVLRGSTGASVTVIDRLQNLLSLDSSGRVRLLISSRTGPPYELSVTTNIRLISVDNEATQQNVETFIRSQVRKSLQRCHKSILAGQDVENKIMSFPKELSLR